MSNQHRAYTPEQREQALQAVRIDAAQGIPASVTAARISINPRIVQHWATQDRATYYARLSAIATGLRFPRDISDKARLRRTQMALRRLSLYRAEHGITLRPTPWPADDPRRKENKAKRQATTTSSVPTTPATGKPARK